jgi:hypothetical protein
VGVTAWSYHPFAGWNAMSFPRLAGSETDSASSPSWAVASNAAEGDSVPNHTEIESCRSLAVIRTWHSVVPAGCPS